MVRMPARLSKASVKLREGDRLDLDSPTTLFAVVVFGGSKVN